ncbi:MAG TPA: disulfide bond formation protein B [Bdellovibrionales bacterium]|nr:disulfide bond formation protein B [Bdellovibrionales bacterium]
MNATQLGLLRISFLVALAGTAGSLFLGEVMKFPPCTLCWYQRICLYPLVVVFGVGMWFEDDTYKRYSLPLTILGLAIAAYHNLLYYGIIPESISPCTQGVSCTTKQLELFGFITIPLMSLATFAILSLFGLWSLQGSKKVQ